MSASAIFTPPAPTFPQNVNSGPIVVAYMSSEQSGTINTPFDTFSILTGNFSTNKSGIVMVNVNVNYESNGIDTYFTLNINKNGTSVYSVLTSVNSTAPTQSYSFNIGLTYSANDSDSYEFELLGGDLANPSFNTSASFIFYPNP